MLQKTLKLRVALMLAAGLWLGNAPSAQAQCGFSSGYGCPGTDYNNYGISSSTGTTLEYDNMVSSFHATAVRDYTGSFRIWGENMDVSGAADLLVPTELNSVNFPGLTGRVLKVALASNNIDAGQAAVLTTDGIFAWGVSDLIFSTTVKAGRAMQKITVPGTTTGLPVGVNPTDVKMMFAADKTLALVTCDASVYVLSNFSTNGNPRGDGSTGRTTWARVQQATTGNPAIFGVVAVRGSANRLMALKGDGTVWTWGQGVYLGNGSAIANLSRATQMTLPAGESGLIKMIGMTNSTYYILYQNGHLYSLGQNSSLAVGDFTSNTRTTWVQPLYAAGGAAMNDILWISPNEHDATYSAINVINSAYQVYNWGSNSQSMLGRGTGSNNFSPGSPTGLTVADKVQTVETGGHTTMVGRTCTQNFGYVGHRIAGSMANGSASEVVEASYTFTTASVQICGATTVPQIFANGSATTGTTGKYCNGSAVTLSALPSGGTFTVTSGPGTITGNRLSFTGTGTVTVSYSVSTADCGTSTATRIFETEACSLFSVSGTIWNDNDGNATRDGAETGIDNDLWVNLVAPDGTVVGSAKVGSDGTYTISILSGAVATGNYSIIITNSEKAAGTPLATSDAPNGDYGYTGTNVGGTPNTGNRTGIINIGPITGSQSAVDFGISNNPLVLPVTFGFVAVEIMNNQLLVKWNTQTETNNSYFEIEASVDGTSFVSIGKVDSKATNGASADVLEYEFTKDASTGVVAAGIALLIAGAGLFRSRRVRFAMIAITLGMVVLTAGCNKNKADVVEDGKLYIRIAQVDKDGTKSYSKVVTVVKR